MKKKLLRLAERRERVLQQIAAQRTALGQSIEPWRNPLARVDQGLVALRYIRSRPAWMIGGGLLIAALRIGHAGKWLGRAWLAWQVVRKVRGLQANPDHP